MKLTSKRDTPEVSMALRSTRRRLFVAGIFCAAAASCALAIDMPIKRWIDEIDLPGDLVKTINYSEVFGHGVGVVWIAIAAGILDRRGTRVAGFLLAHSFLAGLTADALKVFVGRARPYYATSAMEHVADTFRGWFPALRLESYSGWFDNRYASMPSAHAAAAAGLCFSLIWLYPRGRWFFPTLSIMAGMQRCFAGAHYPSDVAMGYGVACLTSAALLTWTAGWVREE